MSKRRNLCQRPEASVLCPYCGRVAPLCRKGDKAYPYRDDFGPVYRCLPCGAWVGCHPNTEMPLGTLANEELRRARMQAHALFDSLWWRKMRKEGVTQQKARAAGHKWLSEQIGLDETEGAHIGAMNLIEVRKVIALCEPYARKIHSQHGAGNSRTHTSSTS